MRMAILPDKRYVEASLVTTSLIWTQGYGYYSFERFCDAVTALKGGHETLDSLDEKGLPTLKNTIATTAILEVLSLPQKAVWYLLSTRPVEGVWMRRVECSSRIPTGIGR